MNIAFLSSISGSIARNNSNSAGVYIMGPDGRLYPLTHNVKVFTIDTGESIVILQANYDDPSQLTIILT
jgi:hypothetical protein